MVSEDSAKYQLIADATGLYWFEPVSSPLAPGRVGSLHYCPTLGCPNASTTLSTGLVNNWALSEHYVYWDEVVAVKAGASEGVDKIIHRVLKPAE